MITLASACQMFSGLTHGLSEHTGHKHFGRPLVRAALFLPSSLAWSHFLSGTSSVSITTTVPWEGYVWHRRTEEGNVQQQQQQSQVWWPWRFLSWKALNGQGSSTHLQLTEAWSGAHCFNTQRPFTETHTSNPCLYVLFVLLKTTFTCTYDVETGFGCCKRSSLTSL